MNLLPDDSNERKKFPIASGPLSYFPAVMVQLARLCRLGNDQHNPGEPMHWARGKSDAHADSLMTHFMQRGEIDADGVPHSVKVAWRACAIAQLELEELGYPKASGAR